MSMLSRYKKAGGFHQLLALLESFGPKKQAKFLAIIHSESPAWAQAVGERLLTIERILTWPDEVLIEIFRSLPPKNVALAMMGFDENRRNRLTHFFSAAENRRLTSDLNEMAQSREEDLAANFFKVIQMVRQMINDKMIHPERFDPDLVIPNNIEDKLDQIDAGFTVAMGDREIHNDEQSLISVHAATNVNSLDTEKLKRKVSALLKENNRLREEVGVLRDKLERIRKIA